jgi:hypothetical protein
MRVRVNLKCCLPVIPIFQKLIAEPTRCLFTGGESGGAVAGAVEDAEVVAPGADGLAILVGEDAGELMEMREVVDGPGGEELGESDDAEGRMAAAEGEVSRADIEGAELVEIFGASAGELVEEYGE